MSQFFRPLTFFSLPIFLFPSPFLFLLFISFFFLFFFLRKLREQSCNGYNNWSMVRETDVARSPLTYLYARDTVTRAKSARKKKWHSSRENRWYFSRLKLFFRDGGPIFLQPQRPHHSVRWTERYSLDGEAKAYIEANGAILADSSPPRHVFPSYTAFPFSLLPLSAHFNLTYVNFETRSNRKIPTMFTLPRTIDSFMIFYPIHYQLNFG